MAQTPRMACTWHLSPAATSTNVLDILLGADLERAADMHLSSRRYTGPWGNFGMRTTFTTSPAVQSVVAAPAASIAGRFPSILP